MFVHQETNTSRRQAGNNKIVMLEFADKHVVRNQNASNIWRHSPEAICVSIAFC